MVASSRNKGKLLVFGNVLRDEAYSRSAGTIDAIDPELVSGQITCPSPFSARLSRPVNALLSVIAMPARFVFLTFRYLFSPRHQVIFVPFPSHIDGGLAILLGWIFGKRVVLDFFYCLYDTVVNDRRLLKSNSLSANIVFAYERFLLRHAWLVLVDTEEHRQYVSELFDEPAVSLGVIPVCIEEQLWAEIASPKAATSCDDERFRVLLWSTFIPLHGVEVVIRAAKEVENLPITIEIIGTGQTADEIRTLLMALEVKNIEWDDRFHSLSYLRERVGRSNACLGVFSTNPKADRVIPYKVYQTLCSGKPLITAKTAATSRILEDRKSVFFCKLGDANSLAAAISEAYLDEELRVQIALLGRQAYEQHLSRWTLQTQLNQQLRAVCDAE